ncbi:hypothetical protein HYFRA_00003102 [Hymenoscyphus fraxineus]|uniref:WSC domain-containing protein n=1 Tax=Hymenoscyphus fraxineus TaxID=746836 RepID=A0A9N9PPB9_9HELO|nr:hypothetical protein HYFRA_00003102 [Hymenoscyphus fraxineus]
MKSTISSSALVMGMMTATSSAFVANRVNLATRQAAPYNYLGCYTEGSGVRALGAFNSVNYTTMTIELCASLALPTYTLFGIEFGGECWAANVLGNGASLAPESECSFGCAGNSTEKCGGSDRLSIYSTKSTTPPAPPAHILTAGPYSRIGCYTEGNGTRALSGATKVDYSATTVESCATFCNAEGWAVMGVEYGGECYCGTPTSFAASGSALVADADCNMLCAGSPSEYCGAGNRLDIYRIPPPTAPPA